MKIALTEDNSVNRNTFINKTKEISDCQLVFVAVNGRDCLERLKGLELHDLPEIIFMDLEMPEMNGAQTIMHAKAIYPQIHFIVLTVFDDEEKIFEAIKSGASGYLLKHEPPATLAEAMKNVVECGGAPMSPAIARKALQLLSRSSASEKGNMDALPSTLTEREKQILQYLVNGLDSRMIADTIHLSVLTVRKHIANIYTKLHVSSRTQAVNLAHKSGWFES